MVASQSRDYEGLFDSMPHHSDKAASARWIAHNTKWGTISTLSSRSPRQGAPFGNIASFSDGSPNDSKGILYFMRSNLDSSMIDIMHDNTISFTLSEMQTGFCLLSEFDAEDPRCARLSLGGRLVEVGEESEEMEIAKTAIFSKHPAMEEWYVTNDTNDHQFGFWKLDLEEIWLLNYYGGAEIVSIEAWNRGTDVEGNVISPEPLKSRRGYLESRSATPTSTAHFSTKDLIWTLGCIASVSLAFTLGRKYRAFKQTATYNDLETENHYPGLEFELPDDS